MTKDELMKLADNYAYEKALVGVGVGANVAAKTDIHEAVRRTESARCSLEQALEEITKLCRPQEEVMKKPRSKV